jgi:hypothetical protein
MATYPDDPQYVQVDQEDEPTMIIDANGDDATPTTPPVRGFEPRGALNVGSVVDLLRQEQEELSSAREVYIPVKGYEKTGLQIRYRMPESGKELDMIMSKVSRQQKDAYLRNLYVAIDTMVFLCDGIYVQPEDVPEPVMLDPHNTGEPCQFDDTLAELLGMENAGSNELTTRQIVRKLFGGNELAIMSHSFDLSRWLQNTKADLNLEIWQVGE